ncbi:differentially expressed in FDCP 6 homolog [Clupea harengus]|uniref:Differentially expressed in FDCP 6 homolog n=1 Tax=Clupea harengus TaxID=7950 RepID=A0A8M1KPP4_CLUHA|nr:differentially expressed in FDCP 6 homolog [Clupea harengus]
MDFKSELLKSIWYAFTSLDAEHCGKVSKSQLKVLSHNLYTVLNIPHDAVTLEKHFQDDDSGPVSNHGYMPYLNNYILAKAQEGTFNKEMFDELCWMMTSKKKYKPSVEKGLCSGKNSFKLFCLFNLLSEDHYPLVMIPQEVEYLLKKISTAMNVDWDGNPLEDLLSQDASVQEGMSVWEFLEFMDTGHLMRTDCMETFSLALDEVFMEMYHNVLKKGYMQKKGHLRKNWQERWFVLKPSLMEYYVGEDLREKKGEISLDQSCVVETIADKEGKRCLFCVKTPGRTYEMSASDLKQRVEWIQANQTALKLTQEGKTSLHQELKLRRRDQRESRSRSSSQTEEPVAQEQSQDLQQEIDSIIQHQKDVDKQRKEKEQQEKEQQLELQRQLERQLEVVNKEKACMVAQIAQMEQEATQCKERIEGLVLTQEKLEKSLNDQILARLEEETKRKDLERRLEEEQQKVEQLLSVHKNTDSSALKEKEEEEQEESQQPAVEEQASSSTVSSLTPPPEGGSQPHTADPPILSPMASTPDQAPQELPRLPEKKKTGERQQRHLEKAKLLDGQRDLKQWNVQFNRLMTPITPGDRIDHRPPAKISCPKQDRALTSTEFITKFQSNHRKEGEEEESQSQAGSQSDQKASADGPHQ